LAQSREERDNPWLLLSRPLEGGAVPIIGEANTVEWILHSGLGKELTVPDGHGDPVKLRVVGLLQDSVFHSALLLSERNFLKLYPRQEGYRFFLIQAPHDKRVCVRALLGTLVAIDGFSV